MRPTYIDNQSCLTAVEHYRTCVNTYCRALWQDLFVIQYVRQLVNSNRIVHYECLILGRLSYQQVERYDRVTTMDGLQTLFTVRCRVLTCCTQATEYTLVVNLSLANSCAEEGVLLFSLIDRYRSDGVATLSIDDRIYILSGLSQSRILLCECVGLTRAEVNLFRLAVDNLINGQVECYNRVTTKDGSEGSRNILSSVILLTIELIVSTLADSLLDIGTLDRVNRHSRVTTCYRLQFLFVNTCLSSYKVEAVRAIGRTLTESNILQLVNSLIFYHNRQTLDHILVCNCFSTCEALEEVSTCWQLICINLKAVTYIILPTTDLITVLNHSIGIELDIVEADEVLRTSNLLISI